MQGDAGPGFQPAGHDEAVRGGGLYRTRRRGGDGQGGAFVQRRLGHGRGRGDGPPAQVDPIGHGRARQGRGDHVGQGGVGVAEVDLDVDGRGIGMRLDDDSHGGVVPPRSRSAGGDC